MGTKADLNKLVKKKLADSLVVVVSNRQPYEHIFKEGKIECRRPAGGVATALDPVLRACGGIWVARGSGAADRKVTDKAGHIKVPPESPEYTLRRVWLTKEEVNGFYFGYANEALWPLCHVAYVRPVFNHEDWEQYKKVNQKYADAVLEEIGNKKALVFVQDYHLALVPKMLKDKRPDLTVIHFWHIPWPNPEAFRICPNKKEILEGLLGNDMLGFHIRYFCDNFLATVDKEIETRIDKERTSVFYKEHEALIRAFPISVDFESLSEGASKEEVETTIKKLKEEFSLNADHIICGLDRIDYTKGIPERLKAIDRLLEKYPDYKGKFTFMQVGAISRIHIPEYKIINDEINNLVEEINWKHSTEWWKPVVMVRRVFSPVELSALYRMSDVCMVTSLQDGMNLVCKEYISSRINNDGNVILSKFSGAARELEDTLMVNPFDTEEIADSLKQALDMSKEEQAKRMKRLREIVSKNNIYQWASKIINELARIPSPKKGKRT